MIHSAPQRNAATLREVLAPFSVSHVIAIDSCSLLSGNFSLFFLFLDFIANSDCVFNNKNHYVLGHTGYQIIITILVISTLNANLRVATRVYDVEGGAIFSKNSTFVFFDGAAWTPRLRVSIPDYGSCFKVAPYSFSAREEWELNWHKRAREERDSPSQMTCANQPRRRTFPKSD